MLPFVHPFLWNEFIVITRSCPGVRGRLRVLCGLFLRAVLAVEARLSSALFQTLPTGIHVCLLKTPEV